MIKKFPKIYGFKSNGYREGSYRGKIKLHGTNGAIAIVNGVVNAQSRERVLSERDDNAGFCEWVNSKKLSLDKNVVIFGEWCGPGIQKGVAINKIPHKIFAVFCVYLTDEQHFIYDPDELTSMLSAMIANDFIVLPWQTEDYLITSVSPKNEVATNAALSIDKINALVDECDKEDPWVKQQYGISGVGEGFVFYPTFIQETDVLFPTLLERVNPQIGLPTHLFEEYVFKVKGKEHRGHKKAASATKVNFSGIEEFLDTVLPQCRLEQGLAEACNGVRSNENIPAFMKWISNDVLLECKDDFAAISHIPEKAAMQMVTKKALRWYKEGQST